MRSGPVRIARYLDQLAVASGQSRREELISEAERLAGEDEGLDFDRGLFEGFRAAADIDPGRLQEWDEFDEDEQAIADVIGIDVGLVRAAGKLTEPVPVAPPRELAPAVVPPLVIAEQDGGDVAATGADDERASPRETGGRGDPPATRRHVVTRDPGPVIGTPPIGELWLLIALLVVGGVIGSILTYLLS
jgi:hypothetical protein